MTKRAVIIGLTGGYGTGKSTAASMFAELGAVVLDADRLSRNAFKRGSPQYSRIVGFFGRKIVKKSGAIDRARLGRAAFASRHNIEFLNSVIHPMVVGMIEAAVSKARAAAKKKVVIIDAPLLFEAGLDRLTDYDIVVTTTRKTQLSRVAKKTGLTSREILLRVKYQMPLLQKIRKADFVIDNEGSLSNTAKTVADIWHRITLRHSSG